MVNGPGAINRTNINEKIKKNSEKHEKFL